jgi:hypothetical protein
VLHIVFIAIGCFVAILVGSGFLFAWGKARAARGAEARVMLHRISRGMQTAYAERHELCPSARTIPADFEKVRGGRYVSSQQEWQDDPGWRCAAFEMPYPQRYQYRLETSSGFVTITAAGDLDGDDVRAVYTLRGHVDPKTDTLVFDPSIEDSNDGE